MNICGTEQKNEIKTALMAIALTMYGTFLLIFMFECVCNKSKKIKKNGRAGIDTKREWILNISHCTLLQLTSKL